MGVAIPAAVLGSALLAWHLLVVRRRDKRLAGRTPSFPMGSLALWRDLLSANAIILHDALAEPGKRVVQQWTFWAPAYAVIDPDHVDAVFRASVSREMRPAVLHSIGLYHIAKFMGARPLLREGLLSFMRKLKTTGPFSVGVAEGQLWRDLRKTLAHSLRPTYVKSLLPAMEGLVNDAIALLSRSGEPLDVSPAMHALTLDVVCATVFKEPLGALKAMRDGAPDPLVDAFSYAAHEMARRTSSANPLDFMYGVPVTRANRELARADAIIQSSVEAIIARCAAKGEETLVSNLTALDAALVRDNVVTLAWAGHDTTAAALSFALRLLATHLDVQDALRDHVKGRSVEELAYDAAELDAVCWETLRLHPPALWTNRGLTEDVCVDAGGGERVCMRAGELVVVPIWAIHRHPSHWDRPDAFLPFERFLRGGAVARNKGRLIPFGSGNRVCPGNALAMVEFRLSLGLMVQRLAFTPVPGIEPVVESVGMFQAIHGNVLRVSVV